MRKYLWSPEVKVGLLVLAGILILFYMSFRIGKFGVLREKGYDINVVFRTAVGIDPKTPVQIAGVEIGRVSSLSLENFKAKVTLKIREGIQLPADSKVAVRTQGVLGDKVLEIIPGSDQKVLAQGDTIREIITSPDFDEIFSQVSSAAKSFGETMNQFKDVLGDSEKTSIRKSIDNIQSASGDLKDLLKTNKEGVTRIVKNADETIGGLKVIMKDVQDGKGTLGLLVKDEKLYKDAKDTVSSLKSITADIEEGKGTLGKLAKDDSLYVDAKETVKNFRDLTDGSKKGEGTLVNDAKNTKIYTETEKSMKKIGKAADAIQEQTPITILGTILGTFF